MQAETVYNPTWRAFTNQVSVMTRANMKARYRKTVAGFFWVVFNPIIMYTVQSQIFKYILKVEIANYYTFLLSGLLPWLFMHQCLEMGTPAIQYNSALLKSYPTSPLVYITAQLLDNFVNFLAAFGTILVFVWIKNGLNFQGLLFLPLAMFFMLLTAAGMTWITATVQVFFRDTKFILTFVLQVLYFLTPIFYPESLLPDKMRWVIHVNPFYKIITPFRVAIYHYEPASMFKALGPAALIAFALPLVALGFWKWKRHDIYFNL